MFKLFEWIYGVNSIVQIDFMAACWRKMLFSGCPLWTHFCGSHKFSCWSLLLSTSVLNDYFLLYKAEKPSVCLSAFLARWCLHFWHADNSAVSARIETGLAQNESCVFEDPKVYFYKPIVRTVHRQECLEDKGVSSH